MHLLKGQLTIPSEPTYWSDARQESNNQDDRVRIAALKKIYMLCFPHTRFEYMALRASLTHCANKGATVTCFVDTQLYVSGSMHVCVHVCRKFNFPDNSPLHQQFVCAVGLLVTLAFDQLGNVLAETWVTKADSILEMWTAGWAVHFKATGLLIRSYKKHCACWQFKMQT